MNPLWITLAMLLALNAVIVLFVVKMRRDRAKRLALDQDNRERQQFIIAKQDELGRIVEDRSLSPDEVRAATEIVLAEILAVDDHDCLVPLVEDNRAWIEEQLARRETTSTPAART